MLGRTERNGVRLERKEFEWVVARRTKGEEEREVKGKGEKKGLCCWGIGREGV